MKLSIRESITKRVATVLLEHGFANRKQPLVVAVSGGPDSLCLLHVLLQLRESLGLNLHVAHLDHGLRGAESSEDALYVERLAHGWGVPATIKHRDVLSYQRERRLSLEQAAREVRYAFFAQVVKEHGAFAVALGHTADDQAETVLMHLVRGSGLDGLAGMREVSELKLPGFKEPLILIRPLLGITREETQGYCQAHSIAPRGDKSNLDVAIFRNAVRQELIPALGHHNPRIKEALSKLARAVQLDLDYIQSQLNRQEGVVCQERDKVTILRKAADLPQSLQRHLARRAITGLLGDTSEFQEKHVEAIVQSLIKPAGRVLKLPRGVAAVTSYEGVILTLDPSALCPLPALVGEHSLAVPGETHLSGWAITASVKTVGDGKRFAKGYSALLDLEKASGPIIVRPRKPGDRFQPLGVKEEKKLQDFMVDAKISRLWRDRLPLVCSPQGILWVVGYRISEKVKVTEATRWVLHLQFRQT